MKNDQLSETILNEETVYQGKFLKVTHAEVSLPNGHTSGRDMVRHPGGVVIVAIGEEDEVYLEHQYRTPLDTVIVELQGETRAGGSAGIDGQKRIERGNGAGGPALGKAGRDHYNTGIFR